MDLLPKIGGLDPYHGGSSQQRPGTGGFARKKKEEDERRRQAETAAAPPDLEIDPLLAEIDRMRALDPALTDSGAHRALKALHAYPKPVTPDPDDPFAGVPETPGASTVADQITTRGFVRRPPTPPETATGSEGAQP